MVYDYAGSCKQCTQGAPTRGFHVRNTLWHVPIPTVRDCWYIRKLIINTFKLWLVHILLLAASSHSLPILCWFFFIGDRCWELEIRQTLEAILFLDTSAGCSWKPSIASVSVIFLWNMVCPISHWNFFYVTSHKNLPFPCCECFHNELWGTGW